MFEAIGCGLIIAIVIIAVGELTAADW